MAKKLRKFLILLDNESLLYFPGSFLTGRVLVDLDEDTAVTVAKKSHSLSTSPQFIAAPPSTVVMRLRL
ncbi:hypothetical protein TNCT_157241 [Trichonephila clavata]|uniref:Uncharacterized protein n=1 Tax=Trichonephila clavata TaxID=2740835 RepID=A0A8X6GIR9_TRICU|nr:hypothetical protein TNCT_157241 [Trichonephila clavata]